MAPSRSADPIWSMSWPSTSRWSSSALRDRDGEGPGVNLTSKHAYVGGTRQS